MNPSAGDGPPLLTQRFHVGQIQTPPAMCFHASSHVILKCVAFAHVVERGGVMGTEHFVFNCAIKFSHVRTAEVIS